MSARENLVAVIMAGGIGSRFGPHQPPKTPNNSSSSLGTLASTRKATTESHP